MTRIGGHRFRRTTLVACLFGLLCTTPVFCARTAPAPPPKDARCPVCGMSVAKFPDWSSFIAYRDGRKIYFDGPKDLGKYYLTPGKYQKTANPVGIAFLGVRDYYTLAVIDAQLGYFVLGSDVNGPMGRDLVPFAKKSDAEEFLSDHQGRRVIRFREITPALLKTLD